MRRCGEKRFVWYVEVCDFEACWPIAFFDSEEKANAKKDAHQLNKANHEREIHVRKAEVF